MFTLPEPPRGCWWPVERGGVIDVCTRPSTYKFNHTCWQHSKSLIGEVTEFLRSDQADFPMVEELMRALCHRRPHENGSEVESALDKIVVDYMNSLADALGDGTMSRFADRRTSAWGRFETLSPVREAIDDMLAARLKVQWGEAA